MRRPTRRSLAGVWLAALVVGGAALDPIPRVSLAAAQTPTFRSAVDLIALDVQVVDGSGTPIRTLGPADFDVSILG